MTELSNSAELLVLDWILGTGTPTRPAASALTLGLSTDTIADIDTGSTITEPPSANGYARQVCAFDLAAAGATTNSALESFGENTNADWGTVDDFCICDSATYASGNIVVFSALDTPRPMTVGDTLEFAIGAITVTAD